MYIGKCKFAMEVSAIPTSKSIVAQLSHQKRGKRGYHRGIATCLFYHEGCRKNNRSDRASDAAPVHQNESVA